MIKKVLKFIIKNSVCKGNNKIQINQKKIFIFLLNNAKEGGFYL